jgi:hypothetical protein
MTRLIWDVPGERLYENGVDRGVLYINYIGTAWSGLVSIAEAPSGAEPRPYYVDGLKYIHLASAEEYAATINAFSSPSEFDQCEGVKSLQNGLYAAQQPRTLFSLSYRTGIGSDTDPELGYKLHIVYHALAEPTQRQNNTLNESAEAAVLSWHITTMPDHGIGGIKPTAHFVIDSRTADPGLLSDLEDLLYGTDLEEASLPLATDLIAMFDV